MSLPVALCLFAVVLGCASAQMEMVRMEGPRMVLRINGNGDGPPPMFMPSAEELFPIQSVQSAFSSSSSLLDDFGHESLFDEIFPQSHRKMEIFPMKMMKSQGGPSGDAMGGLLSNLMSSVLGGMLGGQGHRTQRRAEQQQRHPLIINLADEPTPAVAMQEQQEQQEGHCCCTEIRKFCKQVQHDGTVQGVFAVTRCLAVREKEHHDVQSECMGKVDQTVAGACLDDIEKFCPHVKPGQSGIHTCLFQNRGGLGNTCSNYMHIAHQHMPTITPPQPVTATVLDNARRAQDAKDSQRARATLLAKMMHFQEAMTPTATKSNLIHRTKATKNKREPHKHEKHHRFLVIAASCMGVVVVAAFIGLLISRRNRRAPTDNSHYVAMLI